MLTLKEQLIQEITHMGEESRLKTIEQLDSGENNEMLFECSKESLLQIINHLFDDNLHGCVPNGRPTTIIGWEIISNYEKIM